MKKPKTYFQKYNNDGRQAGREAVNASHPVLKELIAIINEQQNAHYVEKKEVDLFKYNTLWIEEELFNRITIKYYSSYKGIASKVVKPIIFYIGTRRWKINFKLNKNREQDIKDIEEALAKRLSQEKEIAERQEKERNESN